MLLPVKFHPISIDRLLQDGRFLALGNLTIQRTSRGRSIEQPIFNLFVAQHVDLDGGILNAGHQLVQPVPLPNGLPFTDHLHQLLIQLLAVLLVRIFLDARLHNVADLTIVRHFIVQRVYRSVNVQFHRFFLFRKFVHNRAPDVAPGAEPIVVRQNLVDPERGLPLGHFRLRCGVFVRSEQVSVGTNRFWVEMRTFFGVKSPETETATKRFENARTRFCCFDR
uniref:(northern house mosquito) hypothetical protein n=1 Tax=Culex pipiens TaxID=7175 RepID=A0A8D8BBG5_CULPI